MDTHSQDYSDLFKNNDLLKSLFVCAYKILRNTEDARDAVSDVLLSLQLHPKNNVDSLTAYLRTCVIHKCFEILKKKKRITILPEDARPDVIEDADETKRIANLMKIYPEAMKMLEEKCTDKQFEVFQLWLNGVSYASISQELGMEVGAVSSALYRAKRNARNLAIYVQRMMDRLEE
jgi:RNA polymerase sigma factor (sigma-70 family)